MQVGEHLQVTGCFTQYKFLAGKSLVQLERLVGYHPGRLSQGAALLELLTLPEPNQFDLFGYSNVAAHHFQLSPGQNVDVLKREARKTWSIAGPDRLVKLRPTIGDNPHLPPDFQYPHALGIPQWALKRNICIPGRVLAVLQP